MKKKSSLKRDAVWTAFDAFATAGIAFGFRLVVARILAPHDFGIAAIALSIIAVLQAVNEFGLTAALIQKDQDKVTPSLINATFTASAIVSGALALITAGIIAPLAADFYREPLVAPLLVALGFNLLATPLSTVSSALLYRRRDFRSVAICRLVATLGSLMIAAAVLWLMPSPWVVVWQWIAMCFLSMIMLTAMARWRFRFNFDRSHFREMFGFSGFVLASDLIGVFSANAGVFVLGPVLSPSAIGLYSLALYLTETMRRVFLSILDRVTFVHYAQHKHDKNEIRRTYISETTWSCRILFPVMAAMALFGPAITAGFLGTKWVELGSVIRWLSISIIIHAIGGAVSTVYKGVGKPGADLALTVFTTFVLLVPALLVGAALNGIEGAAIATALVKLVTVAIRQTLLNGLIGPTTGQIALQLVKLAPSLTPLILIWWVASGIGADRSPATEIGLAILGLGLFALIEGPRAFPDVFKFKLITQRLGSNIPLLRQRR